MIKINVDAALNPSNSTIAVVARDWRGELIFACSKKVNTCCKIAEAQITKINCENILGLRKISKLTIGTKKNLIQKKIDIKHRDLHGSAIAYIHGWRRTNFTITNLE